MHRDFVIIGGGIAGVCCAKEIARIRSDSTIALITLSDSLKECASSVKVTNLLEELTVFEMTSEHFQSSYSGIEVIKDEVKYVDPIGKCIYLASGRQITFGKLTVCSGVAPRLISSAHHHIIGIRDQDSVDGLIKRLASARCVVVVGNGGIALELVHALTFCKVEWIVHEKYVGSAFFDASAAQFIMPELVQRSNKLVGDSSSPDRGHNDQLSNAVTGTDTHTSNSTHTSASLNTSAAHRESSVSIPSLSTDRDIITTTEENMEDTRSTIHRKEKIRCGYGLGPEWISKSGMASFLSEQQSKDTSSAGASTRGSLNVHLEQEVIAVSEDNGKTWCEVASHNHKSPFSQSELHSQFSASSPPGIGKLPEITLDNTQFPLYVKTNTNQIIGCDFVVSATGVVPCSNFLWGNNPTTTQDESSTESSDVTQSNSCTPITTNSVLKTTTDGFIVVNERMQSSCTDIYAAGDCCCYLPKANDSIINSSNLFYQMRLWSQAKFMGAYAAQCMCEVEEDYGLEMHFELFSHITRFFGHKVVMLGLYNAQGLGADIEKLTRTMIVTEDGIAVNDGEITSKKRTSAALETTSPLCVVDNENSDSCASNNRSNELSKPNNEVEIWLRVTPGHEYTKLVVLHGKVVGALLIGETDLEETCENLILNRLDVSSFGIGLLDPDIDIADYFD